MTDEAHATDMSDGPERQSTGAAVSEREIQHFVNYLFHAVQAFAASDVNGGKGSGGDGDDDDARRQRREAVLGYEVISALMGRNVPVGNSFKKALAIVERTATQEKPPRPGLLTITLFDPKDGKTKPAARGYSIEMRVEESVLAGNVGEKGVVPLTDVDDAQDIRSIVVRDHEHRSIAVAGLVRAVSAKEA